MVSEQPEISVPFLVRRHPDAAEIEAYTLEWLTRFDLIGTDQVARYASKSRFGEFAAYTYPRAPLSYAKLAACWFAWLFSADDLYESASALEWQDVLGAVVGVLTHGRTPERIAGAPLIRALRDLWWRFDSLAEPTWTARFVGHTMDTMNAASREIELRDTGVPPSLDEYIPLRRMTGAVIPCFDLIELFMQAELPSDLYCSSAVQEVILAGVDIVSWTNDLYSLEKEVASNMLSNIVIVLSRAFGLRMNQAESMARQLIAQRVREFGQATERVSDLIDGLRLNVVDTHILDHWLVDVRHWIAGSNQWHAGPTVRFRQIYPGDPLAVIKMRESLEP